MTDILFTVLTLFYILKQMLETPRRLRTRELRQADSKHHSSYYKVASRTSIIRTNGVRFIEDSVVTDESFAKKELSTTAKESSFQRSALKHSILVKSQAETRYSDKTDQIFKNLMKFDAMRLPATIRKFYGETTKIITSLLNSPIQCHSSIMRELKCFMSNSPCHDSYLIKKGLIFRMKERLKEQNAGLKYTFNYDAVALLIKKLEDRCSNSQELLAAYQTLLQGHKYPVSVELMLMYIGIYLHSINSSYQRAQEICKRMLDLLLRLKLEEYITIYLILMIKLKSNLCEWPKVISLISKALAAAWVYKLQDLQIWCYFQFSRAYFSLGNTLACQFFKERSEMSITEQQSSIYREMMEQDYKKEVELMRIHNYYFDLDRGITYEQLTDHAQRERSGVTLKAQVYAKSIAENFKLKHVKNLIARLGEDIKHMDNRHQLAGNPQFLTHQSGIKNLNVYFRVKHRRGDQKRLYTFQNSGKNHQILREMLRNLLIQMKWYVPIIQQ